MTVTDKITDMLKTCEAPLILPHMDADGDCLGSGIALAMALRRMGKKPVVCLEENIPAKYEFLPGREMTEVYSKGRIGDYRLAIAVDTGDMSRLGERACLFDRSNVTVNIDHHATNTHFAQINYVRPDYSSVGEIMFEIVNALGVKIDTEMAVCLYTAIAFDTGGFRYANTTSGTHVVASGLLEAGVDVADVSRKLFERVSYEKIALTSEVARSMRFSCRGLVCIMYVTDEMIRKTGASEDDCEGIVNLGRSIKGVEVAVLIKERSDGAKVNLRSNEFVDVAQIASVFSGGGHKRAAGCTIKEGIDAVEEKIIREIEKTVFGKEGQ